MAGEDNGCSGSLCLDDGRLRLDAAMQTAPQTVAGDYSWIAANFSMSPMTEVPDPSKDHGDPETISRSDHLGIAN